MATVDHRPLRVPRIEPAKQTEVHEDRVVPAQERLPCPERVALTGSVVVGVGDDTLSPSAGGGSAYQCDGGEPGAIGCPPSVKISSS